MAPKVFITGLVAAVLVSLRPFALGTEPPGADEQVRWSQCHIGGLSERVDCLALGVPLDWNEPDGTQLVLRAAIVPALSGRPAKDPLLVLAGGPGQAATDYGPLIDTAFAEVRKTRDIVLLDQRGTGRSNPLDCRLTGPAFAALDLDTMAGELQRCSAEAGVDVRYFTSAEAVRDLERLRETLGAETVNLWGGSFGTRLAQHYVRAYPDRVRAVVLDAALPAHESLFASAPASSQAAWERLVGNCRADSACRRDFGDVDATLEALLERLENEPADVALVDPTTGAATRPAIDRSLVSETVRGALYVPGNAALLPFAITEAAAGRYEPLAALAHSTSAWATESMSVGVTLSVLCSEEVPRLTAEQAARAGDSAFVRDSYYRFWRAACDAWPRRSLPAQFFTPLDSDVSALILSGGADPVTPPALGEATAQGFIRSTHLVAPNGGHTISALGCVPQLIGEFLTSPLDANLAADCLDQSIGVPPFALGSLGPMSQVTRQ